MKESKHPTYQWVSERRCPPCPRGAAGPGRAGRWGLALASPPASPRRRAGSGSRGPHDLHRRGRAAARDKPSLHPLARACGTPRGRVSPAAGQALRGAGRCLGSPLELNFAPVAEKVGGAPRQIRHGCPPQAAFGMLRGVAPCFVKGNEISGRRYLNYSVC